MMMMMIMIMMTVVNNIFRDFGLYGDECYDNCESRKVMVDIEIVLDFDSINIAV